MVENNIKNTISDLINEIKATTENNLSNLEQIMEALIDKVNNIKERGFAPKSLRDFYPFK